MEKRKSGILLHITSLPGKEGLGTLGKDAFKFVDFLMETKQKIWQILPLGPVGTNNSPYQCYSAFAGNILLIDLETLSEEGLLDKYESKDRPHFSEKEAEFQKVIEWKIPNLKKAFQKFREINYGGFLHDYNLFLKEHSWWLNDFALFMAANKHFEGKIWTSWPNGLKYRNAVEVHKYQLKLEEDVEFWKFLQFHFFRQWFKLKRYANEKGVEIMGDMPLYVSTDSVDVWSNTDIFLLDKDLMPQEVGGVPPDYFSEDGQLWGNPVYNWKRLENRNFDWWIARLHFNLNLFNTVRIDHFRGLESFWSIPAGETSAKNGKWVAAKGYQVLSLLRSQIGHLPLVAEDLGIITHEVEKLRDSFGLPGMKVLQFAFLTDSTNEYLPHNFKQNFIAYTGTHDNDTTLGWLETASGKEKVTINLYLDGTNKKGLQNALELVWGSVAETAIAPMQDVLELGSQARMNTPGIANGNWGWRFDWKQLTEKQKDFLKLITEKYNR
jgi:4-alpha-glucanotransferase